MCYKLIGPEIIEETAKKVVIQDLLNPDEISIKKSVRRMYLISNSMHMDAIKAIKTLDTDLALDVDQRDDDVDRVVPADCKTIPFPYCVEQDCLTQPKHL